MSMGNKDTIGSLPVDGNGRHIQAASGFSPVEINPDNADQNDIISLDVPQNAVWVIIRSCVPGVRINSAYNTATSSGFELPFDISVTFPVRNVEHLFVTGVPAKTDVSAAWLEI